MDILYDNYDYCNGRTKMKMTCYAAQAYQPITL